IKACRTDTDRACEGSGTATVAEIDACSVDVGHTDIAVELRIYTVVIGIDPETRSSGLVVKGYVAVKGIAGAGVSDIQVLACALVVKHSGRLPDIRVAVTHQQITRTRIR